MRQVGGRSLWFGGRELHPRHTRNVANRDPLSDPAPQMRKDKTTAKTSRCLVKNVEIEQVIAYNKSLAGAQHIPGFAINYHADER
jgi:hypothetical protein